MDTTEDRRLLLVAYEFPPSAGGGVQRVSQFARFLRDGGWQLRVIAGRPIRGRPLDPSLLERIAGIPVERLPSRNVTTTISSLLGPLKSLKRGGVLSPGSEETPSSQAARTPASSSLSRRIAFPDGAAYWARSVPAAARRMHDAQPFDAILASGPPFSALAIAVRIGRTLRLPVVLDMRDPWTRNAQADSLSPRRIARMRNLQSETLSAATGVITVSEEIAREARDFGAEQVEVVPNGFDPDDMPDWRPDSSSPLRLAFLGRFYAGVTDPSGLFEGIALARERSDLLEGFRLEVVGPESPWVASAARMAGVQDVVRFHGFCAYTEALQIVAGSDAGVVVVADVPGALGVYTGKLFDYLGVGLPVLLFGPPNGAAAGVVRESGAGAVVPYGDVEGLAKALVDMAEAKRTSSQVRPPSDAVRERFDRRLQVLRVAEVLDTAVRKGIV